MRFCCCPHDIFFFLALRSELARLFARWAGSTGFYTLADHVKTYNYSEESYQRAFESAEGKALVKRTEDVAKDLLELLESPLMDKKSAECFFCGGGGGGGGAILGV